MGFKQSKSIKIPSGEESKVQPVPAEPPLVRDGMEGVVPHHRHPREQQVMCQKHS